MEVITKDIFLKYKSLSWVPFETGSQLAQLEAEAFYRSGVTSIHLPVSVTVINEHCFSWCGSLTSITLESDSQISRFARQALCGSRLTSIHLPASVTAIGAHLRPAVELIRLTNFLA
jgi:hypothetical protein